MPCAQWTMGGSKRICLQMSCGMLSRLRKLKHDDKNNVIQMLLDEMLGSRSRACLPVVAVIASVHRPCWRAGSQDDVLGACMCLAARQESNESAAFI